MAVGEETSGCGPKVCGITSACDFSLLTTSYREMQLFLAGYIIIEICEIFTVGKFPLESKIVKVSFESLYPSFVTNGNRPLLASTSE
jgi:hypothetical protein